MNSPRGKSISNITPHLRSLNQISQMKTADQEIGRFTRNALAVRMIVRLWLNSAYCDENVLLRWTQRIIIIIIKRVAYNFQELCTHAYNVQEFLCEHAYIVLAHLNMRTASRNCLSMRTVSGTCVSMRTAPRNCVSMHTESRKCVDMYTTSRNCVNMYTTSRNCVNMRTTSRSCVIMYTTSRNCVNVHTTSRNCVSIRGNGPGVV